MTDNPYQLDAAERLRVDELRGLFEGLKARFEHGISPQELGEVAARGSELSDLALKLAENLSDFGLLYSSVLEHSSGLENELSKRNAEIGAIMGKMRRYLSETLYQRIAGGSVEAKAGSTQRRNLSVFFSDVVGFTELTDTVEPETLSQLLNSYLGAMATICQKWGGTIDKFIGDAVMIYFGDEEGADPVEGARRCVQMALEMQSALGAVQSDWSRFGTHLKLKIRVGINSGYCTVGNFGANERMDYTLVGGNVNVASRLEHLAEPGSICLSGSTYEMVRDLVEVKPMGRISVKGVAHPIDTYSVIGRRPEAVEKTNPLFLEQGAGFDLKPLKYSPDTCTPLEREVIADSLRRALKKLGE
jgi:class 3 adenylate cyclase